MSKVSYIKLKIEDLAYTREKIRETFLQNDKSIMKIKDKISIHHAKPQKTRMIFAVDSGFNRAYETTFTVMKTAVMDEEMKVEQSEDIYLFHADNYQTDRLRRLLMQQSLYEGLAKTVKTGNADGSMVLVDGTITLTVFYPTKKDRREYRTLFRDFYKDLYSPLMDQCLKREIILTGFLKRTGSTYLADYLGLRGAYDVYIMNSLLRGNGQYIQPIPVLDTNAQRAEVYHRYITFYLNLKNWNYRFELLKQQAEKHLECVENLLYLATKAHYGLSPVFSKADEYARVTKREADLKFDYVIHDLDADDRTWLRLEARKRTHFGNSARKLTRRLPESLGRHV